MSDGDKTSPEPIARAVDRMAASFGVASGQRLTMPMGSRPSPRFREGHAMLMLPGGNEGWGLLGVTDHVIRSRFTWR
jgi:hypothetical protein